MPYASLAELKSWVGIPSGDTADDTLLSLALDAATTQVDQYTDRTFTADTNPVNRDYEPTDGGELNVDPISTTTDLVIATDENGDGVFETTWAGSDYRLEPVNAAVTGEPYTRIVAIGSKRFPINGTRPSTRVAARYGWPNGTTPPGVKQATLIQAARLFMRKNAAFGVAGSVEFGSEIRLLDELDRDAQRLLRAYRRNWWVL